MFFIFVIMYSFVFIERNYLVIDVSIGRGDWVKSIDR